MASRLVLTIIVVAVLASYTGVGIDLPTDAILAQLLGDYGKAAFESVDLLSTTAGGAV